MRRAKENQQVPRRYYRPEHTQCRRCGHVLKRAYPWWSQYIVFLQGRELVSSIAYRCTNPTCREARRGQVHTSPVADRLTLRGSSFAVEGIVQIGYWRFWKRWTVAQIHDVLTHERQVPISEREVLYLVGVFLVLLRCTYPLRFAEHAAYFRRHGLFVAVDALRPEKGNRALYVIRELKFGLVLQGVPVLAADHSTLATRVLRPVDALGYRIRGVVSDEEVALCQAVAQVWPRAAHQTCHWHCLRDAAAPLLAADRALKKAVKRALQDPVSAVARTLARLSPEGPCTEVLATYTELIRTSLGRGEQATVRLRESAHRGSLGADRSVAAAEPAKRGASIARAGVSGSAAPPGVHYPVSAPLSPARLVSGIGAAAGSAYCRRGAAPERLSSTAAGQSVSRGAAAPCWLPSPRYSRDRSYQCHLGEPVAAALRLLCLAGAISYKQ